MVNIGHENDKSTKHLKIFLAPAFNVFNGKFEAVFHFAALKTAGESMLEPGKYATSNITGTINILNKMLKNKLTNKRNLN